MQIFRTNRITFNKDEFMPEGIGHVKSLHIIVECRRMIISRVLIDNGSTLDVCLAMTVSKISIKDFMFCPNGMMVRAFMDHFGVTLTITFTKTSTWGEKDLKILVVP